MTIGEKYWLTLLLTFCRYLSILMMGSGAAFLLLGYCIDKWFYGGLVSWPLFIMWGIVNIRYLRALTRMNKLELSKIVEK